MMMKHQMHVMVLSGWFHLYIPAISSMRPRNHVSDSNVNISSIIHIMYITKIQLYTLVYVNTECIK